MKNYDFSLWEQIERSREQEAKRQAEAKDAEWRAKVDAAKRAGTLKAHIMFWLIAIMCVIGTFLLETPH